MSRQKIYTPHHRHRNRDIPCYRPSLSPGHSPCCNLAITIALALAFATALTLATTTSCWRTE